MFGYCSGYTFNARLPGIVTAIDSPSGEISKLLNCRSCKIDRNDSSYNPTHNKIFERSSGPRLSSTRRSSGAHANRPNPALTRKVFDGFATSITSIVSPSSKNPIFFPEGDRLSDPDRKSV